MKKYSQLSRYFGVLIFIIHNGMCRSFRFKMRWIQECPSIPFTSVQILRHWKNLSPKEPSSPPSPPPPTLSSPMLSLHIWTNLLLLLLLFFFCFVLFLFSSVLTFLFLPFLRPTCIFLVVFWNPPQFTGNGLLVDHECIKDETVVQNNNNSDIFMQRLISKWALSALQWQLTMYNNNY